jgi:hypothetical protein
MPKPSSFVTGLGKYLNGLGKGLGFGSKIPASKPKPTNQIFTICVLDFFCLLNIIVAVKKY